MSQFVFSTSAVTESSLLEWLHGMAPFGLIGIAFSVVLYLYFTRELNPNEDSAGRYCSFGATTAVGSRTELPIGSIDDFEREQRQRKVVLLAFIAVLEVETLIRSGCIVFQRLDWANFTSLARYAQGNTVELSCILIYWTVCLVVVVRSLLLPTNSHHVDQHWRYTVCLTLLTFVILLYSTYNLMLLAGSAEPHQTCTLSDTFPFVKCSLDTFLSSIAILMQVTAFTVVGTTKRRVPMGRSVMKKGVETSEEASQPLSEASKPVRGKVTLPITGLSSASPFSYLTFNWMSPVVKEAYKLEQLNQYDLPLLKEIDCADINYQKMLEGEKYAQNKPSFANGLAWRIIKVNQKLFIIQSCMSVAFAIGLYIPAFFLLRLTRFLEELPKVSKEAGNHPNSLAWGYVYCLGLLFGTVFDALVSGQLWFICNSMMASRIRVQLNCLIFDKALKRKDVTGVSNGDNDASSDSKDPGKAAHDDGSAKEDQKKEFGSKASVLNLFTIDVDRISEMSIWFFTIIDVPAEIIIGTIILYSLLGYAAFAGIVVGVLFSPLNHFTSTSFASVQDKLMSARDKRVSLINEVLQSVRMIKYMAFEDPFEKRCQQVRAEELAQLRRNFLLEISFNTIWNTVPILCVLASFGVYTQIMGQELKPSVAFASLAVWNELKFALNVVPEVVMKTIQALISVRRIEEYLRSPEVRQIDGRPQLALSGGNESVIALRNATVTWPQHSNHNGSLPTSGVTTPLPSAFALQDVSAQFPIGKFSLITGSLGSGKTLLLLALLGEVDVINGEVMCPKTGPGITQANGLLDSGEDDYSAEKWIEPERIAFAPQTAWLQNASIRSNICFGLPFWESRYREILIGCSLVSDLAILEDGDLTEIGEKGINLSGGQKARVSLARAIYSRASILLLDDVLSAVDAHTAAHIFSNCLRGPLMKDRTVILVSHHVQLTAPNVDFVLALDNGRVRFEGSSDEFQKSNNYDLLKEEEEHILPQLNLPLKQKSIVEQDLPDSVATSTAASTVGDDENTSLKDETSEITMGKGPRKLIDEETRAIGKVGWSVWQFYFTKQGNLVYWTCFISLFLGGKISDVSVTYWLNLWSASYERESESQPRSVNFYLGIYAGLATVSLLISSFQWIILYVGSLRTSRKLYQQLLHRILHAPLRFFDTQALGRLLNRFGKDIENIDANLPDHWAYSLKFSLGLVTTAVVVAWVAPVLLLVLGILSIGYYHYAVLFAKSARELRRLDSVSKSPLYSIYGEAISGAAVIRAFGASDRFMSDMIDRCTTNITYYWYNWGTNRWISMRFQFLSALMISSIGFAMLLAGDKVDAALAGFALVWALNISNDVLFFIIRFNALELSMVNVERIKEYSEVEQEAAEIIEPRPPAHWPFAGEISVEQLSIRYAPELPNVLHGIDFKVRGGEKIGIVGATGCGKSTLTLSFFRFVEAWAGRIVIDGLDIANVGLKDLRSRLTIIPQDPTILSGNLRSTLDIFEEYSDHDIFQALRRCHLIREGEDSCQPTGDGANRSPFYNLDAEVAEGGSNFSQGQRQLLCMARAILKRNRILLLDEATASVDYETDEKISKTIREEFADCTLLVIAHRLRTVIDFDRILVLHEGNVIEYDTPARLLADSSSRFYSLCRATGKREINLLKKTAEKKVSM